jgi:hypothetical protein
LRRETLQRLTFTNQQNFYPIWAHNGRELFFETLDNHIMVVNYTARADSFTIVGQPRVWYNKQIGGVASNSVQNYDLAPDDKRIVMFPRDEPPAEQNSSVHVTFLLNFFDELRRLAPAGKESPRMQRRNFPGNIFIGSLLSR